MSIANSADNRQVTGAFSITLSGIFLRMQIIYESQPDLCHSKFKFTEEFTITHSVNHLSNKEKTIELIKNVGLPYVRNKKEILDYCSAKKWLLIAEVFKGQWTDKVKILIEKNHGKMVPVPHNMTKFS